MCATKASAKKKAESDELSLSPFAKNEDRLITTPMNVTTRRIFVAATRMNEGKTTTCLGLYGCLLNRFKAVGFIKPIGQRFVDVGGSKVDEDSVLLNSIYNVSTPIEAMSPIAVDRTFTRNYLSDPEHNLRIMIDKMVRGFDRAAYEKDAIIIEGTGHAGVGSVFDMSNAQVAKILGAKAIIVSQAGIGRPIDEIAMNKALFDKYGVEVIGAILNKAVPDKIDKIRDYAGRGLERMGVPLLGIIPAKKNLSAPNLSQIVEEIKGRWINGKTTGKNERITDVVIGAMTAKGSIDHLHPGVLMITPGDREDLIYSTIAMSGIYGSKVISGIILTRNIIPHPKVMEMLAQTNIPVVISSDDSYGVASKINSMTVKTQPEDVDKIPVIQKFISEHVDLDKILKAF